MNAYTHRRHVRIAALAGCASLAVGALSVVPAQAQPEHRKDSARAVLPDGDGWGSAEGGVTGGAEADDDHVYTVSSRAELIAAFDEAGDAPKIIKVSGTVDLSADANGDPIACADYAQDGYTLEKYLEAYDPDTWGTDDPEGPMEDARAASAKVQGEQVMVDVPGNTTLIGEGRDARILGGGLRVKNTENVIIRNLTFEDAFDCFPQWDPSDTSAGSWNSEYDNLVLTGSRHVWIDHSTFTDGRRPGSEQPRYFGAVYEQHDGLIDIVRGSDLVTVSWNAFKDHDKTLLWGNSDSLDDVDGGKLRITLHHNRFEEIGQRAPRVRFGQVDVYNNHFDLRGDYKYDYTLGVGFQSRMVAEHNAFTVPKDIALDRIIKSWKGDRLTENNNYVGGKRVDLLAAHNAATPEEHLDDDAGWTPELRTRVHHPRAVPGMVDRHAGASKLRGK